MCHKIKQNLELAWAMEKYLQTTIVEVALGQQRSQELNRKLKYERKKDTNVYAG